MTNLLQILLPLLIVIESAGNDNSVGKHGELGALQIKPICVRDVNRIAGTQYAYTDAHDRKKAVEMYWIYMTHYTSDKRIKKTTDARYFEVASRMWNGGPNGHRNPKSLVYWYKIRQHLVKGGHL